MNRTRESMRVMTVSLLCLTVFISLASIAVVGAEKQPARQRTVYGASTPPCCERPIMTREKTFLTETLSLQIQGDYVSAGVGLRNRGYGQIEITGIPPGSQVEKALLYWTILAPTEMPDFSQGQFNGNPIYGELIGDDVDPCWDMEYSWSYRADVSDFVVGNGTYDLAKFASSLTAGQDPWTENAGSAPMAEGASLVVVYSNPDVLSRNIIVYDGNTFFWAFDTLQVNLSEFQTDGDDAKLTIICADGQAYPDNDLLLNDFMLGQDTFDGSDPQAGPSFSRGNLWDTDTYDVTDGLSANDTSAQVVFKKRQDINEGEYADCLILTALVFSTTTGNQPPIARSSDISGQPQTMYPNTTYTVSAKYFDPDGREDLKYCYLRLRHPEKPITMMWYQADGHAAPWAGEEGENYLSNVNVTATDITGGNGNEGYELTWSFQINDHWPEVENAIDFGVFAQDDEDLESGWDYDDTNASFTKIPITLSLQIVDPIPELVDVGNSSTYITNDIFNLAYCGRPVTGVAADGVAKLVLRLNINPPASGSATFSIEDPDLATPSSQDGTLSTIDGTQTGQSVTVSTQRVGSSTYAIVLYNSPEDFVRPERRPTDQAAKERIIYIKAAYQGTEQSFPIRITRPPVVLIHGLWGSRNAWDEFRPLYYVENHITQHDGRFWIKPLDYASTNDESFYVNARKVFTQTVQAVRDYKWDEDVAAVQVDAVTHSMGGDLARAAYQLPQFKTAEGNFNAGYFHKVINIGTPHWGSRMANSLTHALADVKHIFSKALNVDPSSDAVKDLARGSPAIQELTSLPGPKCHNIVGIAPEPDSAAASNFLAGLSLHHDSEYNLWTQLFDGQENDLLVGADSQRGGFGDESHAFTEFRDVKHSGNLLLYLISPDTIPETQAVGISSTVIWLLNQPLESERFEPLPTHTWEKTPVPPTEGANLSAALSPIGEGISITSPADGTTFETGAAVTVTVQPTDGVTLGEVFLGTSGFLLLDDEAPFEFTINLPEDEVGPRKISVLGVDANGNTYLDEITIDVTTSASLIALGTDLTEIKHLQVGGKYALHVWGDFSDGQTKDLTKAPDTAYSSGDVNIATVDTNGIVTGVGRGSTTITVTYGDRAANVTVTVETANHLPVANAGQDQVVPIGRSVVLDGSGSSDPDNDQLTYVWELVSRPGESDAVLSSPESVSSSFTPDVEGQYVAKLTVNDSGGGMDSDTVLITAVKVEEVSTALSPAGWHMITLPGALCGTCAEGGAGDLVCALGDNLDPCYIFHYDPAVGGYVMAPPAENIPYHAGMGFWVRTYEDNVPIDAEVQVPTEAVNIPLGNGWNQIGNPFTFAVPANALKVRCGDTELSLTDARAQGWVSAYLFGYDTASGGYVMIDPTSGCLQPWNGYWMRSYRDDCALIIPPTECLSSAPAGKPMSLGELRARGLELPPSPPGLKLMSEAVVKGLKVYNIPNPIRSEHTTTFKVEGKGADLVQAIRVEIYDLSGHKVYTQDINAKELEWHTVNDAGELLANGVYLYQVWVKIGGEWYPTAVHKLAVIR